MLPTFRRQGSIQGKKILPNVPDMDTQVEKIKLFSLDSENNLPDVKMQTDDMFEIQLL